MKIYIGIFNQEPIIKERGYYNLQLGATNNKNVISDIRDNVGSNISEKNGNYCELTGLYWIWKNETADIVGLTHYRRFFYKHSVIFNKKKVLSEKNIQTTLNKYDIIVPQEGHLFKSTVYKQYEESHDIEDLRECGNVIKEIHPEYYGSFEKVVNSNHYYPYNMFICKKEIFDKYCEWLFSILEVLEQRIDVDKKDKYNKRVYGFLGERLFNIWLINNNLKVKDYPVYNVEQSMLKQQVISIIKNIMFW